VGAPANHHHRGAAEFDAFFQEVLHEALGIGIDVRRGLTASEGQRQVAAANHEEVFDQVAVKRARDIQELGLLLRSVRQNGIVASLACWPLRVVPLSDTCRGPKRWSFSFSLQNSYTTWADFGMLTDTDKKTSGCSPGISRRRAHTYARG
jgi:hypothetical protein